MRRTRVAAVQLALRYPRHATEQWSRMWERGGNVAAWIHGEFCYHEACGVIDGATLEVWDPTENRWLSPPSSLQSGYASVLAIRIADFAVIERTMLTWGGLRLRAGIWQRFEIDAKGDLKALGC